MTALALLGWVASATAAIVLLAVAVLVVLAVIREARTKSKPDNTELDMRPGSQHVIKGTTYVVRNLTIDFGHMRGTKELTIALEEATRKADLLKG